MMILNEFKLKLLIWNVTSFACDLWAITRDFNALEFNHRTLRFMMSNCVNCYEWWMKIVAMLFKNFNIDSLWQHEKRFFFSSSYCTRKLWTRDYEYFFSNFRIVFARKNENFNNNKRSLFTPSTLLKQALRQLYENVFHPSHSPVIFATFFRIQNPPWNAY